jgi:hypothetical protein
VSNLTQKISSLFFTGLGLVPLLFIFILGIKKHDIRNRMKQKLESQSLQTIRIQEDEVNWMDEREIWVHNSLFDIHTKKLEKGIYTFTGLYDREETRLVELERKAAGKKKEQNKLLAQFFKSLPGFCIPHNGISSLTVPVTRNIHSLSPLPVTRYREIPTPPPQPGC